MTDTEMTVREFLASKGDLWPPSAMEISEHTGYPLSTVYVALKGIKAERIKRGKNSFGYTLPDEHVVDFLSVRETLGKINGKTWQAVALSTMKVVSEASIADGLTAKDYAEGFESLGHRFLELAAHADTVKDRPDWKIVLGIAPDTEQE